jgi:histone H3/H4
MILFDRQQAAEQSKESAFIEKRSSNFFKLSTNPNNARAEPYWTGKKRKRNQEREQKKMKLNDNKRIQHLWEEILSQNSTKSHLPTVLQDNAKQLIFEYSEELTQALIDSAATVAENRGSKQIDDSDIALLLGTVLIFWCY